MLSLPDKIYSQGSIGSAIANQNDTVSLPVIVQSYDGVASHCVLEWDADSLSYESLSSLHSQFVNCYISVDTSQAGKVSIVVLDTTGNHAVIPNTPTQPMYDVYFTVTAGNYVTAVDSSVMMYDTANTRVPEFLAQGRVTLQYTAFLPHDLIVFNAECDGISRNIFWHTANEVDVWGYTVEQSATGVNWTPIATIPANNLPSNYYSFTDENSENGLTYYRLKSIDIDGSISYSDIIALSCDGQLGSLSVFPNPVQRGQRYSIKLPETMITGRATVYLYDSAGRLVEQEQVSIVNQFITLTMAPNMLSGQYILTLVKGEQRMSTIVVVLDR